MTSLFGGPATKPKQSAMEILRVSKQLPVLAEGGATVAWGVGSPRWLAVDDPAVLARPPAPLSLKKELSQLVAASFDVYMRLQRHRDNKMGRLAPEEIVRASREYREALTTCIFALEDRLDAADDNENDAMNGSMNGTSSNSDADLVDVLKVSLAMWHLSELLFLQRRPRDDKRLAYDVAAWLQQHYGSVRLDALDAAAQRLRQQAAAQRAVNEDPEYWSTIYGLVMMGSGAQAWQLLAQHPAYRSLFSRTTSTASAASARETFESLQRLLVSLPGTPGVEPMAWQDWREACQYLLNTDGYLRSHSELKTLLLVMTADAATLRRLSSSWDELMTARLFLEEPKAVAHRYEYLMASCVQAFCAAGEDAAASMNNFDCIILAMLEYNVQSALQDIHSLGFHWMAAHLADLLTKSGVLAGDDRVHEFGCSTLEFFSLHYALHLAPCRATWQFTTAFLSAACPEYGVLATRSILNREPLATDAKCHRVLAVCRGKKALATTSRHVAVRRSEECKDAQRFAAALQWAARAQQPDECDAITDAVLDECERSGSLAALHEAVEYLDGHPELATTRTLAWFVTYRELQLVLDDRASLLASISSGANADDNETKWGAADLLDDMYDADDRERSAVRQQVLFVSQQAAARLHTLLSSSLAPRRLRAQLLRHTELLLQDSPTPFSSEQLCGVQAYLRALDRSFDRHDFFRNPSHEKLARRVASLLSRRLSESILAERGVSSVRPAAPRESDPKSFAALTARLNLLPSSLVGGGDDAMDDA
ncbi:hypothetical protein PINS_up004065 [Pythium insidiosum]|nr:hypothetical protein PINS_up004065 [Pythium insidiosum]